MCYTFATNIPMARIKCSHLNVSHTEVFYHLISLIAICLFPVDHLLCTECAFEGSEQVVGRYKLNGYVHGTSYQIDAECILSTKLLKCTSFKFCNDFLKMFADTIRTLFTLSLFFTSFVAKHFIGCILLSKCFSSVFLGLSSLKLTEILNQIKWNRNGTHMIECKKRREKRLPFLFGSIIYLICTLLRFV